MEIETPENKSLDDENFFSYDFTKEELYALAKIARKYQLYIPKELFVFSNSIERTIYASMPISEVEKFYQ